MKLKKSLLSRFSFLIFLLLTFPILLLAIKQAQYWWGKALGQPANIVVDAANLQGPVIPIWQNLAQGGEEKYPLASVKDEVKALNPLYIRIDHVYDLYPVVGKQPDKLVLNWQELDQAVNQILTTGALPFLSLSYMPPALAQNGDITGPPVNWNDWSSLVQATIQHFSGRNERNLANVIYEIWNEPDLFGGWRIGTNKDYRLLYYYAVLGAQRTTNTNPFKIGGPSTTAPYQTWVDGFLDYVLNNNLRIDFYSWHRYYLTPQKFLEDVARVDQWLFDRKRIFIRKYITEWGSVSENSPLHDGIFDAAHLIATIRQLIQRVDAAFAFEIKDGLSPEGKKYWGRWGLLTHEKAGGVEKKPKYRALLLLNKMGGERISLSGEGSWVSGFATKDGNKITVILANLDVKGSHWENVPVTFKNLEKDNYSYKETFLIGAGKSSSEIVTNQELVKSLPLSANNVVLIELTKT